MPLHRKILRLMLVSLAIAAVAGAGAVLLGAGETMLRVLSTALLTAAAALLLYPLSRMIDRAPLRLAGVCSMALVVLEYLLIAIVIWNLPRAFTGLRLEEEILFSALAIGFPGAIACIMLGLERVDAHRTAARVGLTISALTALAWLPAAWASYLSAERLWSTGSVILVFGMICVATLFNLRPETPRHWRWPGITAAFAAAGLAIYAIWTEIDSGFEVFIVITSAAAAAAFANIVLLVPLPDRYIPFKLATIGLGIATLVMMDLMVVFSSMRESFGRVTLAFGILTACSMLALLVLARLTRSVTAEPAGEAGHIAIDLVCPRCRTRQDLAIGDSHCHKCHLRIHIEIEEPNCPGCGYLLMHLTSDQCPECGRAITASAAPG